VHPFVEEEKKNLQGLEEKRDIQQRGNVGGIPAPTDRDENDAVSIKGGGETVREKDNGEIRKKKSMQGFSQAGTSERGGRCS